MGWKGRGEHSRQRQQRGEGPAGGRGLAFVRECSQPRVQRENLGEGLWHRTEGAGTLPTLRVWPHVGSDPSELCLLAIASAVKSDIPKVLWPLSAQPAGKVSPPHTHPPLAACPPPRGQSAAIGK